MNRRRPNDEFSPEVRAHAARMIFYLEGDYPSSGSSVASVAERIDTAPQTLDECVKKVEVESGKRTGAPSDTAVRVNALER